jgi:hypothetical protein
MLNHGFHYRSDPVLQPLDTIECRDAVLDLSDPANPREAEWPAAEFIVGNPRRSWARSSSEAGSAATTSGGSSRSSVIASLG